MTAHHDVETQTHDSPELIEASGPDSSLPPIVVATSLREVGITGVQSYVRRMRRHLGERGLGTTLVTPFSWGGPLRAPVFGVRLALQPVSGPAGTVWYRHWHEVFLHRALRRTLSQLGECLILAQDPPSARAALRARQGSHQRVVMFVHFRISQADEWADKKQIAHGGRVFRAIRRLEREIIPEVDGLVYVSRWAREVLVEWLPEAASVPSAVIGGTVTPLREERPCEPLADLATIGNLDIVKNHRFLLAVLAEAKKAGHTYTLDVYGEGPLERDLLRLRQSLGLEEQVRFLGFRPDVRRHLGGYRGYVHACYSESFCLAIAEAMEAGLPIVAADIGPISELYEDGVEGRFWSLDDPRQAAQILIGLLESEPHRVQAGRAARERFHARFDADVVIPRLLDFLADRVATPRTLPGGGGATPSTAAWRPRRVMSRSERPR